MNTIPEDIKTLLRTRSMVGKSAPGCRVSFLDKATGDQTLTGAISSVRINREESFDSQSAVIEIQNVNPLDPTDLGYYTPYRSTEFGKTANEWALQILPSKRILVEAGYGDGTGGVEYTNIFRGVIDDVNIRRDSRDSTITIHSRDYAWMLLDKQVKSVYTGTKVITDEQQTALAGVIYLENGNIATGSEVISSATGGTGGTGTIYVRDTHYTINDTKGIVTSISLPTTVYCSYEYTLNEFYLAYPLSADVEQGTGWLTPGATLDPGGHPANDISAIIKDLCCRAGMAAADVTIQYSEITDTDPAFERCTYMDAINKLVGSSGFEFVMDELGDVFFRQISDNFPRVNGEVHATYGIGSVFSLDVNPGVPATSGKLAPYSLNVFILSTGTGTSATNTTMWYKDYQVPTAGIGLDYDYYVNLATNTDNVYVKESGSWGSAIGTYLIEGTDYGVDYALSIIQVQSARMAYLDYCICDYVYAAWTFQEGWDIFSINLNISFKNMYGTVRVEGESVDYRYQIGPTLWDGATVPVEKTLFVDNDYIESDIRAQRAAVRLGIDIQNRYITTEFMAVAVPWLQLGDCIQIIESATTISEIYRICSLDFDYSQDGGVMTIKAYHVGYAAG